MGKEKFSDNSPENNPLGYKPIGKLLFSFAWPTILGNIVNSLYNIIDQVFIGRSVGYLGNAATNVFYPLLIITLAVSLLFGVGTASNYSIELGRGNNKKAREVAGTGLASVTIIGILLLVVSLIFLQDLLVFFGATPNILPYALDYSKIVSFGLPLLAISIFMGPLIRSDGNSIFPMTATILGVVLNTVLNAIFVLGLGLGIKAVAAATVISQLISTGLLLSYIPRFKNVKFSLKDFIPKFYGVKTVIALGMAPFIFQISATLIQIVRNNLLNTYGAQSIYGSDIPIAIAGIVGKIDIIFVSIVIGFVQGSQPIIGYNYGAKNYERVHQTIRLLLKMTFTISIIAFIIFEVFPRELISIFGTATPEYFEFGVKYMRINLFCTFIIGMYISISTFFTSIQKPKIGVFLSLLKQIIILLPMLLVLPKYLGVDGIAYALPISDSVAFCVAVFLLYRQLKIMPKKNMERS